MKVYKVLVLAALVYAESRLLCLVFAALVYTVLVLTDSVDVTNITNITVARVSANNTRVMYIKT